MVWALSVTHACLPCPLVRSCLLAHVVHELMSMQVRLFVAQFILLGHSAREVSWYWLNKWLDKAVCTTARAHRNPYRVYHCVSAHCLRIACSWWVCIGYALITVQKKLFLAFRKIFSIASFCSVIATICSSSPRAKFFCTYSGWRILILWYFGVLLLALIVDRQSLPPRD